MRKTIIALATAFVLFTTFGCGKNDDDNKQASIVGKWYVQSETSQVYYNGEIDTDTTATFSGNDYYFEFLSNTTLNIHGEDGTIETGSYAYNPDNKTVIITITSAGLFGLVYTITNLTSTELSMNADQSITSGTDTVRIVDKLEMKK